MKTLIDDDNIIDGSLAYDMMKIEYEKQLEKLIEDVHHHSICQGKDGRWRTKNPQKATQTRLELLEWLYNYYFNKLTVQDMFSKWMEAFDSDVKNGHRSYDTRNRFKSDWKRFFEGTDIASMHIEDVKASDLRSAYKAICANNKISRKTLSNAKTIMNSIFDYAVNNDYLKNNIARQVKTKDIRCKEVNNILKVYTDEERKKVIETARKVSKGVYEDAIVFMFCLCARISEVRALKWKDIDFEKKAVHIHAQIVRQEDDNGKVIEQYVDHVKSYSAKGKRFLPLSDLAIEVLNKQPSKNPEDFVFLSNGKHLLTSTFNRHLKRICSKAGVSYLSSHKIRFWAVTNMAINGVTPSQIQVVAGHSNIGTTYHYIRSIRQESINTETWNGLFGETGVYPTCTP